MRKTESESNRGVLQPATRIDYSLALVAGALSLILYLLTLAPTVTGEDSGELIGAAYSLGIPHPPGYPVWTLLAHAFAWIPIGTVGWRVNFFSACGAAGTVSLLTLIGIGLTQRRGASVLGALCFATSRVFWEHAVLTEVYTLSTFFIALLLYLCLKGFSTERPGRFYLVALLIGVGTGVHSTLVLLMPFWLIMVVYQSPPTLRRSPIYYLKLAGLVLCGTAIYGYLPLAAMQNPAVNWGDPETMSRWWDVVSRAQYAFMVDQYPRSTGRFLGQCWVMTTFWLRDFVGLGAVLGLGGYALLFRRRPVTALFLMSMGGVTVLAAIWMQNFEQNREWFWVMRVFLLPAELFTAIGLICALAWLGAASKNLRSFVLGLGVALLGASIALHGDVSKRDFTYAEDYARNILASLPKDAIYVPVADHQAFPILYLQVTEGLRPDVTLLRKYGYLDLDAIPGLRDASTEEWGHFPKRRFDPEILNWILENTNRPVLLFPQEAAGRLSAELVPVGLLVQARRAGEEIHETPMDSLPWRSPLPAQPVSEYTLSLMQYDWASAEARMAFAANDTEGALEHVESAVTFGHRDSIILHNMGVLCARNSAYNRAAQYFEEILTTEPDHEAAHKKLERARELIEATK